MKGNRNTHWLTRSDNANRIGEQREPSTREQMREEVLAEFLGEERKAAVFADLRPTPVTAGSVLAAWLQKQAPEERTLLEEIQRDWEKIIGIDNARQCSPVRIEGDVLIVEVRYSIFQYTLKSHSAVLEQKISLFTAGKIRHLRILAAGMFRRK